ncbi:LytR C-terminal domain-containing protein [Duganella sp. BuS-21]|uniref:LytR C-terminal domain-containing protein n=1 Tax=Duganella sp. BuS-21 TaxID=2943848 RepID=UPI0035A6328E
MYRLTATPVLLAACLLQACSHTPPAPLAVTPLLRIDDARAALTQQRLAQRQQPAAQSAAPLPQLPPQLPPQPAPMTATLPVTPSRMEIVQLGPNEFRLQYRQPAADVADVAAADERIQIVNGNGVRGMGERVRRLLARHGMGEARVVNQRGHYQRTTIIEYLPGQQTRANAMLAALQGHATLLPARALPDGLTLRLVLGRDHAARLASLGDAPVTGAAALLAVLDSAAVPHFNQE